MSPFTPTADPFPHAVADGFFARDALDAVVDEFPAPFDPRWVRFENARERKLQGGPEMWGPATHALFEAFSELAPELGEAFGIGDLTMSVVGGGYHLIPPGGLLDVHTDFNRGPSGLYRRLNLLTYLNPGWQDEGGRLELWPDGDGDPITLAPEFGRTVVFETSDRSWHGHPLPARRWRLSVAAYFFSPDPPPGYRADHSTVWRS